MKRTDGRTDMVNCRDAIASKNTDKIISTPEKCQVLKSKTEYDEQKVGHGNFKL